MSRPVFAEILAAHLPRDRYDEQGESGGTYCTCGDWTGDYFADGEAGPFDAHLAAVLNAAVDAWLEETRDGCGGCKGQGSHRRHCPRHPNYHPWIPLADRAENIGDSIGVPELANRAWFLAGAIRDEMPNHPYRLTQREDTP
jgi:hypothetical protein